MRPGRRREWFHLRRWQISPGSQRRDGRLRQNHVEPHERAAPPRRRQAIPAPGSPLHEPRTGDGPASATCPTNVIYDDLVEAGNVDLAIIGEPEDRFAVPEDHNGDDYCILQGDILQVEYTDPTDASGDTNTVTDSATFDLRNGVLQSDKSVYIIGSDMILTLIEPDFDLDNDQAETISLDLVEWDSDAGTVTMGSSGNEKFDLNDAFDPMKYLGSSKEIIKEVIRTVGP